MDVNKCVNFNGPEITADRRRARPARQGVIVSAHTHQPYICNFGGKLVTSAASFGRADHGHRPRRSTTSRRRSRRHRGERDRHAGRHAGPGRRRRSSPSTTTLSAPLANKVIGTITADIRSARGTPNGQNAAGEQPMGDVIADAMLERDDADRLRRGRGGVHELRRRAGEPALRQISGGEQPGEVTYGEAFTVQPFGNTLVVKTCTGQQIYDVLNQQFNNPAAGQQPDHAAVGQRRLPVDDGRRAARRRRDTVLRRRGDLRRQGRDATAW